MSRKIISVILAIMIFAVVVPIYATGDTETVQVAYNAGYTVPNSSYFNTGNLGKPSNYWWTSVSDINTETKFIDSNGNEHTGYHYTRLYAGGYICRDYVYVSSGGTLTTDSTYLNVRAYSGGPYYKEFESIRLRIKNGSTQYKYKTKGIFSADMGMIRGAE